MSSDLRNRFILGVIIILLWAIAMLLCGCARFEDNRVVVTSTRHIDTFSYEFLKALSIIIKARFNTEDKTTEEIMADLSLAEYNLETERLKRTASVLIDDI